MTIETIIWDWNGTLLNDSHLSLSTINRLLKERNLKNPFARTISGGFYLSGD
jgi:hypothetical protein